MNVTYNIAIREAKAQKYYNMLKYFPISTIAAGTEFWAFNKNNIWAVRNGVVIDERDYNRRIVYKKLTSKNLSEKFKSVRESPYMWALEDNYNNSFHVTNYSIANVINNDIIAMQVWDMSDLEVKESLALIYRSLFTAFSGENKNIQTITIDRRVYSKLISKIKVLINPEYLKPSLYKGDTMISGTLRNYLLSLFEEDNVITHNFKESNPFELNITKETLAKYANKLPNYGNIKGNRVKLVESTLQSKSFSKMFYSDIKMIV